MFSSELNVVCVALGAKNLSPLFLPLSISCSLHMIETKDHLLHSVAEADDAHVCVLVRAPWAINQRTAGGVR